MIDDEGYVKVRVDGDGDDGMLSEYEEGNYMMEMSKKAAKNEHRQTLQMHKDT